VVVESLYIIAVVFRMAFDQGTRSDWAEMFFHVPASILLCCFPPSMNLFLVLLEAVALARLLTFAEAALLEGSKSVVNTKTDWAAAEPHLVNESVNVARQANHRAAASDRESSDAGVHVDFDETDRVVSVLVICNFVLTHAPIHRVISWILILTTDSK
jgi:hypothetical protein